MPLDNEPLTTQEPSLRDTLVESLRTVTESTDDATTDKAGLPADDKAAAPVDTETDQQRADRIRDEKGRFAPGKVEQEAKAAAAGQANTAPGATDAPKSTVEPPSTWKTEEKLAFTKAPPEVQAAIIRREADYARGVSTYKGEYDRVKPLADAVEPLLPLLQQFGREPGEWIQTMGRVHQTFAMGSPEQKVQATLKLLQDYNVPLMDYLQRGGQLPAFNPNQPLPQPVAQQQPDVRALVQAELQAHTMLQDVKSFSEAKDAAGNPRYPHFSTVKQDMIGLLQAGLAQDLEGAYTKAVRTHDDLWQQDQQAKAQSDAAANAAKKQAVVNRAKRNAVSVPSSTPNAGSEAGDKGLRETLRENFREAVGGRV